MTHIRPPMPQRGATRSQRRAIFERDEGRCQRCHRKIGGRPWNADHIVPWRDWGETTLDNFQVLCVPCHAEKTREENPQIGRKSYGEDPSHPDEDVTLVLDAFDKAGSFHGAAKLLTDSGVPTRLGRPWETSSVSKIVRHNRPNMPAASESRQGRSARARHMFTGLLICGTCGTTLSSMNSAWSVRYYCRVAHLDKSHPRPYKVSERKVMLWAQQALPAIPWGQHPTKVNEALSGELSFIGMDDDMQGMTIVRDDS